jgi:hypothetical protein
MTPHRPSLCLFALCSIFGCATAPPPVVPIFAVDYAALSAQVAQACDERAPGTGQRIRQAHTRWQAQHGAAQVKSFQAVQEQAQAEATQRGQPLATPAQLQERWRAQSLQDLNDKLATMDSAALRPYCERWPALFERPDMQFAAMAASQPQSADSQATLVTDHNALFTEAARLCDMRAPGTGAAVTQALLRWQAKHGASKDKLMAQAHAQAQSRADAVGGRVLPLEAIKAGQRARAIERQRRAMNGLGDAAVLAYCEKLPRELERADMDFTAQWQAQQRSGSSLDGVLVLVDHGAASQEAARACDRQAPGSGAAIQSAHTAWSAQHGAAQRALLESFHDESRARTAARGSSPPSAAQSDNALELFRAASLDKLKQSMAAMDPARLARFCQDYPGQYAKPEMDFAAIYLRERSNPRR